MGLDSAIRLQRRSIVIPILVGISAIAVGVFGVLVGRGSSRWDEFVRWSSESGRQFMESYSGAPLTDPAFLASTAHRAATACYIAAATLAAVAVLLWLSRVRPWAPYVLILIATFEMLLFAHFTRATMEVSEATAIPEPWNLPIAQLDRDARVLTVPLAHFANLGMALGFENLNGYDPGVFKRYAEVIFASQGADPSTASQYFPLRGMSNSVFRMLRCALVCFDPKLPPSRVPGTPLPLALLISDWVQLDSRDLILSYMTHDGFDPASTVVLESPPGIKTAPAAAPPGAVRTSRPDTDTIEIEAVVNRPAILLVTTNYSSGWRIIPIESAQPQYQIQPANWTQIAIPLERGRHRLTLEYSPLAFRVGRWVSIFALLVFGVTSLLLMRRSIRFR
jgi:hypothetical protein